MTVLNIYLSGSLLSLIVTMALKRDIMKSIQNVDPLTLSNHERVFAMFVVAAVIGTWLFVLIYLGIFLYTLYYVIKNLIS